MNIQTNDQLMEKEPSALTEDEWLQLQGRFEDLDLKAKTNDIRTMPTEELSEIVKVAAMLRRRNTGPKSTRKKAPTHIPSLDEL